jgi:hypothetical protein
MVVTICRAIRRRGQAADLVRLAQAPNGRWRGKDLARHKSRAMAEKFLGIEKSGSLGTRASHL